MRKNARVDLTGQRCQLLSNKEKSDFSLNFMLRISGKKAAIAAKIGFDWK